MNAKYRWLALFVLAWILWERVLDRNSGLEKWRNLGAFQTEGDCKGQREVFAYHGYNKLINSLPPGDVRNGSMTYDSFVVEARSINEAHIFQCYPPEIDPRPR